MTREVQLSSVLEAGVRKTVHAAILRSISGCNSATLMSVFAALLGLRRPCSHCSSVRLETPSSAANCAWVRPAFRRARTIGERGSTIDRLPPPDFISRTPSSTSCQTSRLASNLASARPLSFLPMFKRLLQLLENMCRHIFLLGFGIQSQHPELVGLITREVDHAQAATLTHALAFPT